MADNNHNGDHDIHPARRGDRMDDLRLSIRAAIDASFGTQHPTYKFVRRLDTFLQAVPDDLTIAELRKIVADTKESIQRVITGRLR